MRGVTSGRGECEIIKNNEKEEFKTIEEEDFKTNIYLLKNGNLQDNIKKEENIKNIEINENKNDKHDFIINEKIEMKEEKNIISNYKDDDHKIYVTKDSEIEELNEDKIKNNKEVF